MKYYSNPKCGELIPHYMGDYKYKYFTDYVKNDVFKNKGDSIYISDRSKLKSIKPFSKTENNVVFRHNGTTFSICKEKINFDQLRNPVFETPDPGLPDSFLIEVNNAAPFGLTYKCNEVEKLKFVTITNQSGQVILPDTVIDDLYFPNFTKSAGPIKPISLYFDKNSNCIYLYIFGMKRISKDENVYDSYMAKLIFRDGQYIGRGVVGIGALVSYQWDCPTFKGF